MWKLGGDSSLLLRRKGVDVSQLCVWLELSVGQEEQQSIKELRVSSEREGGPGLEVDPEEPSEASGPA